MDGIKTSDYLIQAAIRNIEGEIDFKETQVLLDTKFLYYAKRGAAK